MPIDLVGENCIGCSACTSICPVEAIRGSEDDNGFYVPEIDPQKCINCKGCERVCPVLNRHRTGSLVRAYYGWHKDAGVCAESSSGGAFSAIAEHVLEQRGVVFGAVYGDDKKGVKTGDTGTYTLADLRRSKYVASNPEDSFKRIRKLIYQGRTVLFVGTPCMCAGLKNYVGGKENLLTCDFICGGVASPQMFREHMESLETAYGSRIHSVNFRPKVKGWKKQWIKIDFENGASYSRNAVYDLYFNCFMRHLSIRMACNSCKFRSKSSADLTIADFWGYKAAGVRLRKEGISMIGLNTAKGIQLFEQAKDRMEVYSLDQRYTQYAYMEKSESEESRERQRQFLKDAAMGGFEEAAKKAASMNAARYLMLRVLSRLKLK